MPPTIFYADNRSIDAALDAVGDDSPVIVVLQFDRREIESGLTGSALDRLMSLGDNRGYVRRLANSCGLLVSGYDKDHRELYEIPEVRSFFGKIAYEWGGWLHFLEKDGDSLSVFLSLLVDVSVEERVGGAVSTRLLDPQRFGDVLMRLFDGMNEMYRHHGFGAEENARMTDAVMAVVVQRSFIPDA